MTNHQKIQRWLDSISEAPAHCLGQWTETSDGREFGCDHEFAGETTCDYCVFSNLPGADFDPRFSSDEQPKRPCRIRS